MKNKVLEMGIAVVMAASLVTGCGSSSTGASSDSNSLASNKEDSESQASGSETAGDSENSYTMFIRSQYHDWIKELNWYDVAEKNTGITVNYVDGPEETADVYNEVDQRIASGTLPDVTMCKLSQSRVYGEDGAFVDLAPYIKKYAPNLQKYIDDDPAYAKYITNDDGAIYGLVRENASFADLIGYRADQFEKAGVDVNSIKTVDDFTEALRSLKAFYGKENSNYYPLSGRDTALRFAAWFKAAAYVDENGSGGVYYGHEKDGSFDIKSDGAYKWIETMKEWYDEGLINPSWIQGTNSEQDWESQMLDGSASVFYDFYNRSEWFMENGGPEADPDYDMQVMDYLKEEDGTTIPVTCQLAYGDALATSVNSECDESKIKTILTFIDYFYSEEGKVLANWGVKGESYDDAADGSKEYIVNYQDEESKGDGEKKWSFLSDRYTVCKPVDQVAFHTWNTPLIAEAANRNFLDENMLARPVINYSTEQQEELSNLVAAVYDSECMELTKFITGDTELNQSNWDSFISDMDDMGLSQIESIQAGAYKN